MNKHWKEKINDNLQQSDFPIVGDNGQAEQVTPHLESGSNEKPVQLPTIGLSPINEFDKEYYIVRAFAALFPCVEAELKTPRNETVSPIDYFQRLTKYLDQRFAKDPRFRFFVFTP